MTDTIGPDQAMIAGQPVTYNYVDANGTTGTLTPTVTETASPVMFDFGDIGTKAITFLYKTKVTNPQDLGTNQVGKNYTNEVVLDAKSGGQPLKPSRDNATQKVTSTVLEKKSLGYDYAAKRIQWQVTVNQNGMPMNKVTLKDVLPDGVSIALTDEIDISGYKVRPNDAPVAGKPFATYSDKTLALNLGDIRAEQVITFYTLVDMDYFAAHGATVDQGKSFEVPNEVKLDYWYGAAQPVTQTASGKQTIKSQVVSKTGKLRAAGSAFIDYAVLINPNGVKLQAKSTLTDQLPKVGTDNVLELDTTSLKLEKGKVTSDNVFTKTEDVPVTAAMYTYSAAGNNLLTIHLPVSAGDTGTYRLTYSAEVVKAVNPIKNTVAFNGAGQDATGSSEVAFSVGGGGGAVAERKGSIKILNTDDQTPAKTLPGAVFEVLLSGSPVKEGTANAQGEVTIPGLKMGTAYTVRQKTPPVGYQKNTVTQDATADAGSTVPTLTFVNSLYTGTVRFLKTSADTKPLAGASFALYQESDEDCETPIAQRVSGADGIVLFDAVAQGKYWLKETAAPSGYQLNTQTFGVTINNRGECSAITDKTSGSPMRKVALAGTPIEVLPNLPISITGVTLNPPTATLKVGETQQLTATVEPADAIDKTVTWSSSDDKIATVDSTGKVTAVGAGVATITVKTRYGGLTATSEVTVFVPPTKYTIIASAGTDGTITPSGSAAVIRGESQAFTVTPSSGYSVSSVLVDGVEQGAVTSYNFQNVTANHTISVAFGLIGSLPDTLPAAPIAGPVVVARPAANRQLRFTTAMPSFANQMLELTQLTDLGVPDSALKFFHEVELQASVNNGVTWGKAAPDDVLDDDITVAFPIPEDTSPTTYSYKIYHFADGAENAPNTLPPTVHKPSQSLTVTVKTCGSFVLTATPNLGGGGGNSSGSGSSDDDRYDFWANVRDEINRADGGVIKVNAYSYDKMPTSVMDALRNNPGVTLVISWSGGNPITIAAGKAQKSDGSWVYYPFSELAKLYAGIQFVEKPLAGDNVNPETGGGYIIDVGGNQTPVTGGVIRMDAPTDISTAQAVTTSGGVWLAAALLAVLTKGALWCWKKRRGQSSED